MSGIGNLGMRTAAIALTVLAASPSPFKIPSASSQQLREIRPAATGEPVALFITICLWSEQRPATFRELPLTPGAAGPGFASIEACHDGQAEALHKWRTEAGSVFGFTSMAGDGYRIEGQRCGPVVGNSGED
jgi:hypothetical protein